MNFPNQPQPGFPQGYVPQPNGYVQQPQPGFPQGYPNANMQQFAGAVPQAQPEQQLAKGSLDAFYNQPSGGGGTNIAKFFKVLDAAGNTVGLKPIGTELVVQVARNVTHADIRQQTSPQGQPKTYKNGDPMFVMVIPLKVEQSELFPDGEASFWVKGRTRDELVRAMAEAGVDGAPQGGAFLRVQLAGQRPIKNMQPEVLYTIQYTPPQGGPVAAPVQTAPQVQQVPGTVAYPDAATVAAAAVQQPQFTPEQLQALQAAQVNGNAAQTGAGFTVSADQANLLAQLKGQQG